MSRTFRSEILVAPVRTRSKGRMRRCEMCEAQFPFEEMYPIVDDGGAILGYTCEVCSADVEMIEEIDGDQHRPEFTQ